MKYVEVGEKNRRKQKRTEKFIILAIMVVMGLLFICIGISNIRSDKEFYATAVSTTGTITDIQVKTKRTGGEMKTEHIVYVAYEVDGQDYENTLNYYYSGMSVGKTLEVWYQPDKPDEIRTKTGSGIAYIMTIGGGLLFLGLGIWVFLRKDTRKEELGGYNEY